MQGVVKRAEIGVHLFLHVARQEAEPFAGFNRWPGQHNAVHAARLQQSHPLRHRQIGLACSRRPNAKHHVVAGKHINIGRLGGAARCNRALARADRRQILQGQARFALRCPAFGEPQGRFHFCRADMFPPFQPFPQREQSRFGHFRSFRPAGNGDAIPA